MNRTAMSAHQRKWFSAKLLRPHQLSTWERGHLRIAALAGLCTGRTLLGTANNLEVGRSSPVNAAIQPEPNGSAVHQTASRLHLSHNQLPSEAREQPENARAPFELIDAPELARRWNLPASWIREQTRSRSVDPIPHLRLGRYVRFEWGSSELEQWLTKRRFRKG